MQESGDGEDALARLLSVSDDGDDRFDLVICDVNLPKRSGASLVNALKSDRPAMATRVILSTGDDVEDAAPGTMLQSYPNILQKPFDLSTLRALVERVARPASA